MARVTVGGRTSLDIAEELANLQLEYAMVLEQEARAKISGYLDSQATSITGREWDAKINALEPSCEAIKIRGEIEAHKTLLYATREL